MQSMQSSRNQNYLFASPISDPRKSILPTFDNDNDPSPAPPSAYTLDFDFSEFDTHLFPSPQFETFLSSSYFDDKKKQKQKQKKPANPQRANVEPIQIQPVPDVKLSSFMELEEDCSALQFDSEVIVLTRPRTPLNINQSHHQTLPGPSTSRAPTPARPSVAPRTQSGLTRKESKCHRNAPPHLHLKGSDYEHFRRLSRGVSSRSRRETRSSVGLQSLQTDVSSPVPTQNVDSHPNTPKSFKAFRVSYASSKSSKRASRICFSTKELHRRRILKLQRTFGERVPLELVAVSPARRRKRRSSKRFSAVSYRGPYAVNGVFGGPIDPSVGDWTLDRIAPPPPLPKSSCGIFRTSIVPGDLNIKRRRTQRNTLRKSRAMSRSGRVVKPEDESFEVIEHEGGLEEGDHDHGDNSIWLDEDPPIGRKFHTRPTSRLVTANEHERLTAMLDDIIGRKIHTRPTSRLVTAIEHERMNGILATEIQAYEDDINDEDTGPGPSNVNNLNLHPPRPLSEALSVSDQNTSIMSHTRSSSPSMPAFYHGSDSDHTHLHPHRPPYRPPPPLSLPSIPAAPSPRPITPAMLSPALFWPRLPFSAPITQHQQVVSTVRAGSPLGPYDMTQFVDVHENVLSTRRSERRQGWSGEWNQPTIREVISKLRNM